MKFLHLSDLHIGKFVNGFSMLEDQVYILQQIIQYVKEFSPQAVIIAGDVYDRQVPSGEAVKVFDEFLTDLAAQKVVVLVISGNHDSPERLGFLSRIMQENHIYFYTIFDGKMKTITLKDKYGEVDFHLLPFIKPTIVKHFYQEEDIKSYEDAVHVVLNNTDITKEKRNVLVAHQFFVNSGEEPIRSDSEIAPIGGVDSVSVKLLKDFDYTALGHLHGQQQIGKGAVYYCGSPLKYSFSEYNQKKNVHLVELLEKGEVAVKHLPLQPLHDMRKIKGPMSELLSEEIASQGNKEDYMHITLTDDDEIIDAIGKMRKVYPNVMALDFDNKRTLAVLNLDEAIDKQEPFELFQRFFSEQNGTPLTMDQKKVVSDLLDGTGGGL